VRAVVRPDFLLQLRILNPFDLDSKKPLDDSLAEVGVFHHAAEHKVVCEAKLLDRLYAVDIVFIFVHITAEGNPDLQLLDRLYAVDIVFVFHITS